MNKTLVSISTAVTAAALCIAVPAASAAPLNNAQSIPADLSSQQTIPKEPEKPKDPNNPQQYATYAQRTSHIALIPSSTIRQKRDRYAHRLYPQYGKHTKSHTKSALAQLYSVQLCCYFVAATRPYPHKRTRKHTGITQTALLNTAILQPIFQLSLHYNSYYYSAWCL